MLHVRFLAELVQGTQAVVKELTRQRADNEVRLLDLVGSSSPLNRVDLRFGQNEAGAVYALMRQDEKIRKLAAAG